MINFTILDCSVRHMNPRFSTMRKAHEKNITLAVLNGKTYMAAPLEQARGIVPDLNRTLVVTSDAKLTGCVLHRCGISFDRIVSLEDLIHYVDGAGADCSPKTFAAKHHLYFRDTGALEDRMRLMQTAARVYLPQVPEAEIALISHTHRLYTDPVLLVDTGKLTSAKECFLRKAATALAPFSIESAVADIPIRTTEDPRVLIPRINATVKKMDYLLSAASIAEGKLPVYLNYCGAVSGRFTGGDGFNIQGLARSRENRLLMFNEADCAIRGSLKTSSGMSLIAADVNAMEPRIIAWLSGDPWLTNIFASRHDLYLEFGKRIAPATGSTLTANLENPVWRESLRKLAKMVFLAMQYGAGAYRLWQSLQEQLDPQTREAIFGDEIHQRVYCWEVVEFCKKINVSVTSVKHEIFNAFMAAVTQGLSRSVGIFRISATALGDVIVDLPSGRRLLYHSVRITPNISAVHTVITQWGEIRNEQIHGQEVTYLHSGKKEFIYESKLFENIVQAIGRDLLGAMILRAEQQGIRIVTHVHDELIAVVPDQELAAKQKFLETGTAFLPEWAHGLTLSLKTTIGMNFSQL